MKISFGMRQNSNNVQKEHAVQTFSANHSVVLE
ncbi:calcium/calmodulin-dependent protein kinase type 1 [Trichinella spiralis]|nr:calcium/calmodulin-dependent protein kinase type 1 [Trichinella spiralis]